MNIHHIILSSPLYSYPDLTECYILIQVNHVTVGRTSAITGSKEGVWTWENCKAQINSFQCISTIIIFKPVDSEPREIGFAHFMATECAAAVTLQTLQRETISQAATLPAILNCAFSELNLVGLVTMPMIPPFQISVVFSTGIPASNAEWLRHKENLAALLPVQLAQLESNSSVLNDTPVIQCSNVLLCIPNPHPQFTAIMTHFLIAFANERKTHFDASRNISDLDDAISALGSAIELLSDTEAEKPRRIIMLYSLLSIRFSLFWGTEFQKTFFCMRSILQGIAGDTANLSSVIDFKRLQNKGDIEMTVALYEDCAARVPNGHLLKPGVVVCTADLFSKLFKYSGKHADIDKQVSYCAQALHLNADQKYKMLSILATSLAERFQSFRKISDIDEAISYFSEALNLTPNVSENASSERANLICSLGNCYFLRFTHLGTTFDCIMSVIYLRKAAVLASDDNTRLKARCLFNLSTALSGESDVGSSGNLNSLNEAISCAEQVVRLCEGKNPDDQISDISIHLASLFSQRFLISKDDSDIDTAISMMENHLPIINTPNPSNIIHLHNIATAFLHRFEISKSSSVNDIENAIRYYRAALQLTRGGSRQKAQITFNLGKALLSQYNYGGYDNALQLAIGNFHFVTSCPEAPPLERFWAACQWADNDPESKLNGYHAMIEQLPQLAWLGLPVIERHTQLFRVGSRMCEAVAYAIASQRNLVALEWAEQGRSFVWSQLLQLDAPTEEIGHQSQELAFRLMEVMKDLRSSCTRDVGGDILTRHLFDESAAQHQHRLCKQWEDLVADVRKLHGFEDFLKPMTAAQILSPNYCGYVIVINVTKSRCDALALCPGNQDVVHIPLPGFSYERATELRQLLNIQVGSGIWRYGRKAARQEEKSGLLNILSELWLRVVEPILCGLDLLSLQNTNLPRVWWCTAGPLACLPIHAAGIYDRAKTGRKVLDFVVSSYTPSVATLQHARTRVVAPKSFKMLAVAVPNAPDAPPLPNTVRELDVIQHIASSCEFLRIEGVDATTDAVLQSMADCSWVHLACHAEQDPKLDDAMQHGLLLADGRLALARIIAMSCPSADFAFLSACQTAMNDHRMPEEAAHLGAGMLAAGYRSVIATMWAIKDDVAPEVAEKVYPQLFKGSKPDSSQAAYALHNAQKEYCDSGRPLETWVPFIHLGI